jgi:hypothetical protein
MVLAEHYTSVHRGALTAVTLEKVTFDRPHRVGFRLRGPAPCVEEEFALSEHEGVTAWNTPASWAPTSAPQASGGATGPAQHGKPPSAHRSPASAPKHSAGSRSSPGSPEGWFVSCIGLFGRDIADLAVIGPWSVTAEITARSLRG